ncbi:kinesin light chain, putative [Talaromyces stipitatus ATCC 10500]|uniref:Kinesin light chain, putative n=1 Tax=Talaromyces stipitatus (strain ATCC 10500 / CBS 375.48 / QM 6759 / NRRL 1006) TaxID=441959 RepID=B8LYN1_TALSN|nr:kinesin light chain, putative [Talaromyces stipitatus ATCC 10500]EED23389.1 kinesin light chain, putative [Talaromyces stipitatus ATCC 10500]
MTVSNLGGLYTDQGKLKEAETMYQRALTGYEKALGPGHSSTLVIVNNLGNLYRDQGKPKEAETMYQRALAGFEKACDPNDYQTKKVAEALKRLIRSVTVNHNWKKQYFILRALLRPPLHRALGIFTWYGS